MPFRYIPPGRFRMGSRGNGRDEEPVHWVEITRGYWMAETPVTQAQFGVWTESVAYRAWHEENRDAAFDSDDNDLHRNRFNGKPDHPAENLNWHEASAFCAWLWRNASNLPPEALGSALPSEAQWERACRGPDELERGHMGHRCDYHSGDGEAVLTKVGWYQGNAGGTTHEVGLLDPNGWGLYDMHGNVWEWCRDWWHDSPYILRAEGCHDPEVTEETPGSVGTVRVLRGGSWGDSPQWCRSAFRYWWGPAGRYLFQGFRPVLLLSALPGPEGPGSGGAMPTEPG